MLSVIVLSCSLTPVILASATVPTGSAVPYPLTSTICPLVGVPPSVSVVPTTVYPLARCGTPSTKTCIAFLLPGSLLNVNAAVLPFAVN